MNYLGRDGLSDIRTRLAVLEAGSGGSTGSQAELSSADALFLYFGFLDPWKVRRVLRADGSTTEATQANNPAVLNLTTAWPVRGTLTYA